VPLKDASPAPGLEVISAERPSVVDELARADLSDHKQRSQEEKLRAVQLANEKLELQNQQLRQDNSNRQLYAQRLFLLIICWFIGLFALLFFQGFAMKKWFLLPENVLLAAIGGSTLNVLGVFAIVVRYLFPPGDKQ